MVGVPRRGRFRRRDEAVAGGEGSASA
uniref:Uncharacterized protein n=1 Tax=Arundo donax TaxID=35708 RepID=A0A0A9FBR2_ARUDO